MIRMFVSLNQDGSEIFLITIFGFFVEYWVVQQVVRLQEVTIFGWQHNFIIYKYVVLNLVAYSCNISHRFRLACYSWKAFQIREKG